MIGNDGLQFGDQQAADAAYPLQEKGPVFTFMDRTIDKDTVIFADLAAQRMQDGGIVQIDLQTSVDLTENTQQSTRVHIGITEHQ